LKRWVSLSVSFSPSLLFFFTSILPVLTLRWHLKKITKLKKIIKLKNKSTPLTRKSIWKLRYFIWKYIFGFNKCYVEKLRNTADLQMHIICLVTLVTSL
jgi:hypothetical protein